jgi:hypothetical protein
MPIKLTIDIQYASPAIEAAVSKAASATLIKKWVKNLIDLRLQRSNLKLKVLFEQT